MLHADIITQIPGSFDKALSEGDLFFFSSTVSKHEELNIEYEIRLCPALQKKPTLPTPHFDPNVKSQEELPVQSYNGGRPDPFSPPYVPNLYIGDLSAVENGVEYPILLNKYSVIPHHFLMVTKEFQSQTSLLKPPELAQIYMLLNAGRQANRPFVAFYNCGDNSGASQPHKHVQFIPIEGNDGPPIERLAKSVQLERPDKPFSLTSLPYANHVFRFTSPTSPTSSTSRSDVEAALANIFISLLDLTISTIRHDPEYPRGSLSYNVIMTLEHMHVIPRKHETHTLHNTGEKLSVNALGFAGMLLVKSEEELEAVKQEGWSSILKSVGLKSVHDIQIAGTSLEAADGTNAS